MESYWLREGSIYRNCIRLVAAALKGDHHFNDCFLIAVQCYRDADRHFSDDTYSLIEVPKGERLDSEHAIMQSLGVSMQERGPMGI